MNYYIDITLLPDPEFKATVLLNSLYIKLHKALCDLRSTSIGISFPKYETTLGNALRIHGEKPVLNDLQGLNWIGGMNGYCNVSEITPAPSGVKYRTVSRVQTTMSNSKLNRLLKRGSITEEEAKNYRAKMFTKGLDNPYLDLVSGSNSNKHRRYIEFGDLLDEPVAGTFDQFGLSKTATVPWFE
jgi:CRISPR-associated endonuclease Csy4